MGVRLSLLDHFFHCMIKMLKVAFKGWMMFCDLSIFVLKFSNERNWCQVRAKICLHDDIYANNCKICLSTYLIDGMDQLDATF